MTTATFSASDLSAVADPVERARATVAAMEAHREAIAELGILRRAALKEAVASGTPVALLAQHLGLSKVRLYNMLREEG